MLSYDNLARSIVHYCDASWDPKDDGGEADDAERNLRALASLLRARLAQPPAEEEKH